MSSLTKREKGVGHWPMGVPLVAASSHNKSGLKTGAHTMRLHVEFFD